MFSICSKGLNILQTGCKTTLNVSFVRQNDNAHYTILTLDRRRVSRTSHHGETPI